MRKVIEYGAFRAEVDASNLDNVKIQITMIEPMQTSDYDEHYDAIYWDRDLAQDLRHLREDVHDYIHSVWKEKQKETAYAV